MFHVEQKKPKPLSRREKWQLEEYKRLMDAEEERVIGPWFALFKGRDRSKWRLVKS